MNKYQETINKINTNAYKQYEEAELNVRSMMDELMFYSNPEETNPIFGSIYSTLDHVIMPFIEQHKPPTLDEVVKAWGDNGYIVVKPDDERIYFNRNGYEIEFKIKEIEYEYDGFITLELHKLINLTIRYLESQKE